jgi:AbrB family looped-hinge helix DNA binding protein
METRVSSKGQVVLPKAVREELDWAPGTDLTVERCEDGVLLRRTVIDEVIGMFKVNRPITDEEIEQAIEAGYRARWRRKR